MGHRTQIVNLAVGVAIISFSPVSDLAQQPRSGNPAPPRAPVENVLRELRNSPVRVLVSEPIDAADLAPSYIGYLTPILDSILPTKAVSGYPSEDQFRIDDNRQVLKAAVENLSIQYDDLSYLYVQEQRLRGVRESASSIKAMLIELIQHSQKNPSGKDISPDHNAVAEEFELNIPLNRARLLRDFRAETWLHPNWIRIQKGWLALAGGIESYDYLNNVPRSLSETLSLKETLKASALARATRESAASDSPMDLARRRLLRLRNQSRTESLQELMKAFDTLEDKSLRAFMRINTFRKERYALIVERSETLNVLLNKEKSRLSREEEIVLGQHAELAKKSEGFSVEEKALEERQKQLDDLEESLGQQDAQLEQRDSELEKEELAIDEFETMFDALRDEISNATFSCPFGHASLELCSHQEIKRNFVNQINTKQKEYLEALQTINRRRSGSRQNRMNLRRAYMELTTKEAELDLQRTSLSTKEKDYHERLKPHNAKRLQVLQARQKNYELSQANQSDARKLEQLSEELKKISGAR